MNHESNCMCAVFGDDSLLCSCPWRVRARLVDSYMDTNTSECGKRKREKGKEKEEPAPKRRVPVKREDAFPDLPEVPFEPRARPPAIAPPTADGTSGIHHRDGKSQGELQWIADQRTEIIRYFLARERTTLQLLSSVFENTDF